MLVDSRIRIVKSIWHRIRWETRRRPNNDNPTSRRFYLPRAVHRCAAMNTLKWLLIVDLIDTGDGVLILLLLRNVSSWSVIMSSDYSSVITYLDYWVPVMSTALTSYTSRHYFWTPAISFRLFPNRVCFWGRCWLCFCGSVSFNFPPPQSVNNRFSCVGYFTAAFSLLKVSGYC